jgi:sugar-specific transcriptional regulator TrmB
VRGGRTRAGKARPGRFTEQVVAQLARGPQTAIEVADALGVSPQRTYGPLQRLVALGQARKGGKPITFELIAARDGSMAA